MGRCEAEVGSTHEKCRILLEANTFSAGRSDIKLITSAASLAQTLLTRLIETGGISLRCL